MPSQFIDLFQVPGHRAQGPDHRAKFLSRVFGIFSENIVRLWSASAGAPYKDLGRPTVRFDGEATRSTLDFTLRNKESNKTYVAEMKCEIEYKTFEYFVLKSNEQLDHHTKKLAFQSFLRAAREPSAARVTVRGRPVLVDGAILIWGAAEPCGCADVRRKSKLADVLTVESMVDELTRSNNQKFVAMLEDRRKWLNEMFDGLAAGPGPGESLRIVANGRNSLASARQTRQRLRRPPLRSGPPGVTHLARLAAAPAVRAFP